MAIYWRTPGFKGRTLKVCVLSRWDFNFCVHSSPLRGLKTNKLQQPRKSVTYTPKSSHSLTLQNRLTHLHSKIVSLSYTPKSSHSLTLQNRLTLLHSKIVSLLKLHSARLNELRLTADATRESHNRPEQLHSLNKRGETREDRRQETVRKGGSYIHWWRKERRRKGGG